MKKILLLSDTHGCADDHILKYARQADENRRHAGDIGSVRVADTLSSCAVFRAVYGNIDGWERADPHIPNDCVSHAKERTSLSNT